jgi:5-methylcytosine-specific restriction endonuclease McrA
MALRKICSMCRAEKDVRDFYKHKGGKDGLAAACKSCRAEWTKKYILEHSEKRRATTKKYRDKNIEKRRMSDKKYRLEHKTEQAAYSKEYALKHPECCRRKVKRYGLKYPDRVKETILKRKNKDPVKFNAYYKEHAARRKALKKFLAISSGADMELLRLIYLYSPSGYHVDHVIPLSHGGLHHPSNLQYLPAEINLQKSNNLNFDCSPYAIKWQSLMDEKSEVNYGS